MLILEQKTGKFLLSLKIKKSRNLRDFLYIIRVNRFLRKHGHRIFKILLESLQKCSSRSTINRSVVTG